MEAAVPGQGRMRERRPRLGENDEQELPKREK
jgi:hypothetical protein